MTLQTVRDLLKEYGLGSLLINDDSPFFSPGS